MNRNPVRYNKHHQRGATAILLMMYLVIFGSLATAMAIVSQGNLATADAHRKMSRSLAAAETGMWYINWRLRQVTAAVLTTDGLIDGSPGGNAEALWDTTRQDLFNSFVLDSHHHWQPPTFFGVGGQSLQVGPISAGAIDPANLPVQSLDQMMPYFTATFQPHPIATEDYDAPYYQRPPYSDMTPAVSNATPLDATWVRIRVDGVDGQNGSDVTRSIQMDFKLDKKIRFALLSRSRVMIGRNVMIDGPVGSRFLDTQLANGHPIQMESDFRGLSSTLDAELDSLIGTLITNDLDGDNRINLANTSETTGIVNPTQFDKNGDGYIDGYDFFLEEYDLNADGQITAIELDTASDVNRAQLLELIDTFGDPTRVGYDDGIIDDHDRYAKIRGEVKILATMAAWNAGAAGGAYQDFFQGPIHPTFGDNPLTFSASDTAVHDFQPSDFDVSSFATMASGDLAAQAATQATLYDPADPSSPQPLGASSFEEVPYGAAHPYDYYNRPVYENMTFTDVTIPEGNNALFVNCTFVGATFVETNTANTDPNYNFTGMLEADGTQKYPGMVSDVNGADVPDTKTISNNVRFDGCTFEGAVISDAPSEFTHVRNKIAFTGQTQFIIDNSTNLNASEKALFKRSTILAPHYSIEMGTFINPSLTTETVELSGTIVAGVLDARGQINLVGTIMTTFEPQSDTGPVVGPTSPQFNTTLGYFPSAAGDLEAELPTNGMGVIHIRYDPDLALPDGILGPIEIVPNVATYFEGF